ncbi:MAG: CoA transferase, partial [Chloroflexota bacterium]|nr:CoA transferase [Chloroflexota bacterium]
IAPGRIGNAHPQVAPYQDFKASDGEFMTAANNDDQFRRLCEAVDLPGLADDVRFVNNSSRVENRPALEKILNERIGTKSISHWMIVLQNAGLTVTPINTIKDVLEDPQAESRKAIWNIEHPTLGNIELLGSALQHLSRTPAEPQSHPPLLGEHTFEVMENVLGLSESEIKELVTEEVIKGR